MNKKYTENEIQDLLLKASGSIVPSKAAFDVFLNKLDLKTLPEVSPIKRPIVSPFTMFKLAGAFSALLLVLIGARGIQSPLNINPQTAQNPQAIDGSPLALNNFGAEPSSQPRPSDISPSSADSRSLSFAKSSTATPEARAIESAAQNSMNAESSADSDLLAISDGI